MPDALSLRVVLLTDPDSDCQMWVSVHRDLAALADWAAEALLSNISGFLRVSSTVLLVIGALLLASSSSSFYMPKQGTLAARASTGAQKPPHPRTKEAAVSSASPGGAAWDKWHSVEVVAALGLCLGLHPTVGMLAALGAYLRTLGRKGVGKSVDQTRDGIRSSGRAAVLLWDWPERAGHWMLATWLGGQALAGTLPLASFARFGLASAAVGRPRGAMLLEEVRRQWVHISWRGTGERRQSSWERSWVPGGASAPAVVISPLRCPQMAPWSAHVLGTGGVRDGSSALWWRPRVWGMVVCVMSTALAYAVRRQAALHELHTSTRKAKGS